MLKRLFVIISYFFIFNAAILAGDRVDISGPDDFIIPKSTVIRLKMGQRDGDNIINVEFGKLDCHKSTIGINLSIREYGASWNILQAYGLVLRPDAQEQMGLPWDKFHNSQDISSQKVKRDLLGRPVQDLLTEDSLEQLMKALHLSVNRDSRLTRSSISIQNVCKQFPSTLPFHCFLQDLRPHFLKEGNPNLQTIPFYSGKLAAINVLFLRNPSDDTYTFGVNVRLFDGDLRSFSLDSGCLLQDEFIFEMLKILKSSEGATMKNLVASLQQKTLRQLIGPMGHRRLIGTLSAYGFEKRDGNNSDKDSVKVDYSILAPDLQLQLFCEILEVMAGSARIVTWGTKV